MEPVTLLEQLVKIKSYSGGESGLRNFISQWFKKRNIKSLVQGDNLIVFLGGINTNKAFIFNSHMDTVSMGDKEWKYNPWKATKVGDKVVGLGASDMKSGLAATMLLAEQIVKKGKPPVDMFFTYVVKEEVDGSGTQSFAQWFKEKGYDKKYKDMAAIFAEPSDLKEIEYGHRGNIFIKVTAHGDSGHGSRPHLIKKHAVRELIKFADVLRKEFPSLRKEFADKVFEPPTVGELTSIQSGVAVRNGRVDVESPNKFPSMAVATFDIRTTPKFHDQAFARIVKLGKECGVEVEYAFPPAPAGYTDPKEKIILIARKIVKGGKLAVASGSGDLGFLTALGIKGVGIGPGIKDQAHATNEYCYPNQIPEAVNIYEKIVDAWAK